MTVLLIGLQGCTMLPNAQNDQSMPYTDQVEFESAQGPVSAVRGEGILDRLKARTGASDLLQKHMAYEQAVNAQSPLVLGNKIRMLQNGPATYTAMFAAIRAAKDNINLETYIFADDEVGNQFADLLLERQAAGVQVNVIYDAVGGMSTPRAFFERMRNGGIKVLEFNPLNPLADNKKEWKPNHRDHRKLLVIDGRIAFVGGINIDDSYSSSPQRKRVRSMHDKAPELTTGWRDTHVQIEGPVVAEFQKLFVASWARQKGEPLTAESYFPVLTVQGDEIIRAMSSSPEDGRSLIYLTLMSAITHAEQKVQLTIAYFAPDSQFLAVLTDAARRGVEVTLVMPSYTDSWAIFNLGRSYYTELLSAGVKIYERRGAVMHSKTACIDSVWSTIGSTNLDWRSFLHNDEINAVVLGRNFAAQLEEMFVADMAESDAITLEQWQHRALSLRLKEQLARLAQYWL